MPYRRVSCFAHAASSDLIGDNLHVVVKPPIHKSRRQSPQKTQLSQHTEGTRAEDD